MNPFFFFPIARRGRGSLLAICALVMSLTSALSHAKDGLIECANLIYASTNTSHCFSAEFLSAIQRETTICTERRFTAVKLASDELFRHPFAMMTGEADFRLTSKERENLKQYVENGGFLLASAGCSSKEWDRAFRRELKLALGENLLKSIPLTHPLYSTVRKITKLNLTHGGEPGTLEGVEHNGKLVVVYSKHGLNDTAHTQNCCCCGGNEIGNSLDVNMNILAYAVMH